MGLAPKVAADIFRTLRVLRSETTAILLVEQNANLAFRVAERGYVIETGRIVLEGTTKELLKSEEVRRAYLGGGYRDVWEQ
jgi:branched-chain amino acid transport system ATP-binding protein